MSIADRLTTLTRRALPGGGRLPRVPEKHRPRRRRGPGHAFECLEVRTLLAGLDISSIRVVKDAVPNDPQDFTYIRNFGDSFSLDDDADPTLPNSMTFELAPGSYTVSELPPTYFGGSDNGWELTSLVISGDNGNSTKSGITAMLVLDPGENITVTYTNTRTNIPRSSITVVKDALPNDPQDFSFTRSFGANFSLDDDADPTLSNRVTFDLAPGNYSVTELAQAGWDLSSLVITGDDGDSTRVGSTANLVLDPGENITVTYTNTKRSSIRVIKDAVPNDPQDFIFTRSFGANFSLDDDSDPTLSNTVTFDLAPGNYSVTELTQPGWNLANLVITGDDGDSGRVGSTANLVLDPGENITVTYTNINPSIRLGSIRVVKDALPNDPQDFTFIPSFAGAFSLDDDADPTLSNTVAFDLAPGNYSVTELAQAGWDLTSLIITGDDGDSTKLGPTASLVLDPGENITVTYTNTRRSSIRVVKDTVPNDPQDFVFTRSFGANFSLDDDADPTLSNTTTFDLAPGNYSVTELAQAGWDLSSLVITGDDGDSTRVGSTANLVLDPGENITVTYTNTRRGSIRIVKDAVPNDPQDFTFSRSFGGNFSLDDDGDPTLSNAVTFDLAPGNYSVTELTQPGWNLANLVITGDDGDSTRVGSTANLVLDPGENITVTYTNINPNIRLGSIRVVKDTLPNDPQDFTFIPSFAGAFSLDDDADPTLSNTVAFDLAPGNYSVTELAQAGWDLISLAITGDDGDSTRVGSTANLVLDPGENITVTYTNARRSSIRVVKDSVPNDPQDFIFASSFGASFSLDDDGDPTLSNTVTFDLAPGNYSLTELAQAGWDLTNLVITGDDGDSTRVGSTANLVLDPGENITVTYTNTNPSIRLGSIRVVKDTLPNDPQDFTFIPSFAGGFSLDDDADPTLSNTVAFELAPGNYSVTELAQAGWDLTSLVITGDDGDSTKLGSTANLVLDPGENITVTYSNTRRGSIRVVKDAVPNEPQDFTFTRTFGANFSLDDDADPTLSNTTTFDLTPGNYSLTELAQAGWDLTSLVITGDDGDSARVGSTANLVLDPGENITVTYTNTKRGSIRVIKDTVPNDPQDFTFSRNFGANFNLDDDADPTLSNTATFDLAPGSYSVTELAQAGWDLTSLVITGDDGDSTKLGSTATLVLDPGENITVTYSNTKRGSIRVVKDTVPNDPQDFAFTTSFGANFSLDDDADPTLPNTVTFNLAPGNYSVTELAQAGWDLTSLVITGDDGDSTKSGPTANLVLDPGENITLTYTNAKPNTARGSIRIVKDTVPNDPQDFTFTRSFDSNFILDDDADPTLPNTVTFNLAPGNYSVTELAQAGWDLTSLVITGDDGDSTKSGSTANLVLDPGENITVTYTNAKTNTARGSIRIVKDTVPNGPQDFTFTRSFGNNFSLDDDTDPTLPNSVTFNNLAPGNYSVSELAQAGWDLTSLVITGDDGDSTKSGSTANLVLDPGENITVTYTNAKTNTARGSIRIVKDTVPNDPQDFTFTRSFGNNFSLDDDTDPTLPNSLTFNNLAPGNYSVTELAQAGWNLTSLVITGDDGDSTKSSSTANLVLDPGENITVTYTNTKMGRIIVEKQTSPDGSSQLFAFDPSWSNQDLQLKDDQKQNSGYLTPGSYSVTELVQDGWRLTNIEIVSGDTDRGSRVDVANRKATIDLDPGENIRVRFRNEQLGQIIVEKQTNPEGSSQQFVFDPSWSVQNFGLTGKQEKSSNYLTAGSYSVSEMALNGWRLANIEIVSGDTDRGSTVNVANRVANLDLDPGEIIRVRFRNEQLGKIIVEKQTSPAGAGQSFAFDPSWSLQNFQLSDKQEKTSVYLAAGTYSVRELVQNGWRLAKIEIISGDIDRGSTVDVTNRVATLDLDPGEVIRVRFQNEAVQASQQPGALIVAAIEDIFALPGDILG